MHYLWNWLEFIFANDYDIMPNIFFTVMYVYMHAHPFLINWLFKTAISLIIIDIIISVVKKRD